MTPTPLTNLVARVKVASLIELPDQQGLPFAEQAIAL
jgi:hypothetical protein